MNQTKVVRIFSNPHKLYAYDIMKNDDGTFDIIKVTPDGTRIRTMQTNLDKKHITFFVEVVLADARKEIE